MLSVFQYLCVLIRCWHSVGDLFLLTDTSYYGPSSHVFFRWGQSLCWWPAQLFSSIQFSISAQHQLEQLSHLHQSPVPLHFPLPIWLLPRMPFPVIGPFIFRVLDCYYQLMGSGWVWYVRLILPSKNFRRLPWCCIEWFTAYLVRCLPFIWIAALLKLINVMKVVQFLSFLTGLPDIGSDCKHSINKVKASHFLILLCND